MNVNSEVNFDELARCTDDFNGAQLKAVCVEAGMIALRRGAAELNHEDYMDGEWVWLLSNVGVATNVQDSVLINYRCVCFCLCRYSGGSSKEEDHLGVLCLMIIAMCTANTETIVLRMYACMPCYHYFVLYILQCLRIIIIVIL